MEEASPLDSAHAAMAGEGTAARLNYYARLSEAELFVLLAREATGDLIEPRVFPLEAGPVVLAFDSEARLADFAGGGAFYAALSGRMLAALLDGRGLSLGINFGCAGGAALLPPSALSWLAGAVADAPREVPGQGAARFLPPTAPEALVAALASGLAPAAGLARGALLADAAHGEAGGGGGEDGGGEGRRWILAFVDARGGAEEALARAAREALVFSGVEGGVLDVAFVATGDAALPALSRVGLPIDLRLRPRGAPAAPGGGAAPPPRLR